MRYGWLILTAAIMSTTALAEQEWQIRLPKLGEGGEVKKKAGDKYWSIDSFFRNIEYMNSMQMVARGNTTGDPQEMLDAMRRLAEKILDEDKIVDEKKLNEIYPLWGTKYKASFVRGTSVLLGGITQRKKEDIALADSYFAEWDTWWRDNHSKIFLELHNRYGYEIR